MVKWTWASVAVARPPPDAVARLARKLAFLPAFLTPAWRQFAPRWLQYPVMDTVLDDLKRFGFGHADPLD